MFSITVTVNTSYETWNDSAMLRFDDHIYLFFLALFNFRTEYVNLNIKRTHTTPSD